MPNTAPSPLTDLALSQAAQTLVNLAVQMSDADACNQVTLDRTVLESFIRSAMTHHFLAGVRSARERHSAEVAEAVKEATSYANIAELLRTFASKYDTVGWHDEACTLRDAATEVGQMGEPPIGLQDFVVTRRPLT